MAHCKSTDRRQKKKKNDGGGKESQADGMMGKMPSRALKLFPLSEPVFVRKQTNKRKKDRKSRAKLSSNAEVNFVPRA